MLCFCSRYIPVIIVHVHVTIYTKSCTLMKQYTIIQIYFLCMFILLWSCSVRILLNFSIARWWNICVQFFFWGGGKVYWEFLSSLSMLIWFVLIICHFYLQNVLIFILDKMVSFFNVTMSFIIFWDFVEFSEINTWINLLFYLTSIIIFWDFVGFSWINTWINLLQQWTFFNFLFSRYACAFNQVLLLKLSTFPQIHHIFTIHTMYQKCKQFYCAKILCTDISDKKRKL